MFSKRGQWVRIEILEREDPDIKYLGKHPRPVRYAPRNDEDRHRLGEPLRYGDLVLPVRPLTSSRFRHLCIGL